jgi:hypothetical protein
LRIEAADLVGMLEMFASRWTEFAH